MKNIINGIMKIPRRFAALFLVVVLVAVAFSVYGDSIISNLANLVDTETQSPEPDKPDVSEEPLDYDDIGNGNDVDIEDEITEELPESLDEHTDYNYDGYEDDNEMDEQAGDAPNVSGAGTTGTVAGPTGSPHIRPTGEHICFLSGMGTTYDNQQNRPVAIVINNDFRAQPTVGMGAADIIYEVLIEGGVTRFTMLVSDFDSVPVFGSTRSARNYMSDLSQSHDAIFVHAGGTTMAYTELNNRGIDRLDGVNAVRGMHFPETFYRDAARRRTMALEHTMMVSGAGISAGIRRANYRTRHESDFIPPFRFHAEFTELPEADTGDNVAHYIAVPFARNTIREFVFNPEDGLYYRRQFSAAHIDGATGEQLRFENVIVMFAEYTSLGMAAGYLACRLVGTGSGFYITGGRYTTIRWSKDSRDGPLHFFNWDGSDLYLNPGRTFICVTPTTFLNRVTINADLRPIG